jgi:hypothetical protein
VHLILSGKAFICFGVSLDDQISAINRFEFEVKGNSDHHLNPLKANFIKNVLFLLLLIKLIETS